jgi:uncharacterized protein YjaG (DUF416 family)
MDHDLESEPGIEGLVGLAALSATGRAAFAAACAQRLLPLYVEYVRRTGDGDAAAVSGHLDLLWTALAQRTDVTTAEDPDPWADEVERFVPDPDVPTTDDEYRGYAENAVAAVVYALRSRNRADPAYALWAAQMPVQAIEARLLELADGDAYQVDAAVARHPAVVEERRCQRRDLGELLAAEAAQEPTTAIVAVRARAQAEQLTLG